MYAVTAIITSFMAARAVGTYTERLRRTSCVASVPVAVKSL